MTGAFPCVRSRNHARAGGTWKIWTRGGGVIMSRTELYRHFDSDGRLLYVGISLCTVARLSQHRSTSHWFNLVRSITIAVYPTREAAMEAERIAIETEEPLYNVAFSPNAKHVYGQIGLTEAARVFNIPAGKLRAALQYGHDVPVRPIDRNPWKWRRDHIEAYLAGASA